MSGISTTLRKWSGEALHGFHAIRILLRRTFLKPFGSASSLHFAWLLVPLLALLMVPAVFVGMVQRREFELIGFGLAVLGLVVGLVLVAWVGRAFDRGSFGKD
jgi:uncharacterized membrane protein